MTLPVVFSPDAQNDLHEIYDWYDTKLSGLGERFIEKLEERLELMANTPGLGPVRYIDIRCALIPDFPYLIHYGVNSLKTQLIVYRIFHTSRKPLWD